MPASDSVPKPGTIILDFHKGSNELDFMGAWQILQDKHVVEHKGGKLLLGVEVKKVHNLTIGDKREWKKAMKLVLDKYRNKESFDLGDFAFKLKPLKDSTFKK